MAQFLQVKELAKGMVEMKAVFRLLTCPMPPLPPPSGVASVRSAFVSQTNVSLITETLKSIDFKEGCARYELQHISYNNIYFHLSEKGLKLF